MAASISCCRAVHLFLRFSRSISPATSATFSMEWERTRGCTPFVPAGFFPVMRSSRDRRGVGWSVMRNPSCDGDSARIAHPEAETWPAVIIIAYQGPAGRSPPSVEHVGAAQADHH